MAEEPIIHALNYHEFLPGQVEVDGENKAHGLIPRDYNKIPRGAYPTIKAVDIPLIPQSEWSDRIKDKIAQKSQTSDLMKAMNVPCLDQNGRGYCWAHSTTGAVMAMRAMMNEPTVELSAYAVACVIKNYADEGGWGAESADFITQRGVPSSEFWPQRSMSRANDNSNTWSNAALHKITGAWVDMQAAQYDRSLTFQQYATAWLSNKPTVNDENWWSHSIMGADLVEGTSLRGTMRASSGKLLTVTEFDLIWNSDPVTAGYGCRIRNSWGASWGDQGFGVLAGSKAVPDGGLALYDVLPSNT